MRKTLTMAFLALVLPLLLLTGCGNKETAEPQKNEEKAVQGERILASSLLTQEEVTAILEEPAADPEEKDTSLGGATCYFHSSVENSLRGISIGVEQTATLKEKGIDYGAKGFYDAAKELAGDTAQELTGLGDEAIQSGGQIWLRKGDTVVLIMVGTVAEGKPDKALEVAKIVAGRI